MLGIGRLFDKTQGKIADADCTGDSATQTRRVYISLEVETCEMQLVGVVGRQECGLGCS